MVEGVGRVGRKLSRNAERCQSDAQAQWDGYQKDDQTGWDIGFPMLEFVSHGSFRKKDGARLEQTGVVHPPNIYSS